MIITYDGNLNLNISKNEKIIVSFEFQLTAN